MTNLRIRLWQTRFSPRHQTHRPDIPGVGVVETWCDVTDVDDELVWFRWTHVFESQASVLTSDSTMRFRSRESVERS